MFGYILNPDIVNQNWRITYDDFEREVEEVTKTLVENTAVFPTKVKLADIKDSDYDGYAFVEKIKDIKYGDDVISEAIDDYVHTASMIQQELEKSEIKKKSLLQYEENLKGVIPQNIGKHQGTTMMVSELPSHKTFMMT